MDDVSLAAQEILQFYLSIGKPFASVRVEEIALEEEGISVSFAVEEGSFVKITGVDFQGRGSTSGRFLHLESGLPLREFIFDYEKIQKALRKLNRLDFVEASDSTFLRTTGRDDYANLIIPVRTRRSNSVSGSFFYLAQTNTTGGKIFGVIKNIAGRGHSLSVNWDRPDEKRTYWSFIFRTRWLFSRPLHSEISVSVRTEEFSDRFSGFFRLFYSLGDFDIFTGAEYIDFSSRTYFYKTYRNITGVVFNLLDYPRNPSSGILSYIEVKNGKLNYLERDYYDFYGIFSVDFFFPKKPFALRLFSEVQACLTDAEIDDLEILYGGEKGPRGYLKESIPAEKGFFFLIEPRLLTGRNSNVFVFFDFLSYKNALNEIMSEYSFGAGFSAGTEISSIKVYIAGNPRMASYKEAVFYADVTYDF
ncbi:hypothetical protein JW890_06050 [candidate division WOR-3 bacterium]|nr:hypothetical protein [candidate division WOR-3 bacterium]